MNKAIIGIGGLVFGFVTGFIVAVQITKKTIKQASKDEIEKIRSLYFGDKKKNNEEPKEELKKVNKSKSTIDKFDAKTEAECVNYSTTYTGTKKGRKPVPRPYIITEDEYINSEYDQKGLYYFADGVLSDDEYNIIPNVEEITGNANLMKFGEDGNDPYVIYIRNDKYKIDYEVMMQEQDYADAAPKGSAKQFPSED